MFRIIAQLKRVNGEKRELFFYNCPYCGKLSCFVNQPPATCVECEGILLFYDVIIRNQNVRIQWHRKIVYERHKA
jgi:hypothetical protein